MGAAGLMTDREVTSRLQAYINVEAAGSGGTADLFEAGPGNGWLIGPWARRAPHPRGALVRRSKSTAGCRTTRTSPILARQGIPGLNFALVGDGYAYHTARDVPERLSPKTVRETGENVVAIATALDRLDVTRRTPWGATFFDIGGVAALSYSMVAGWVHRGDVPALRRDGDGAGHGRRGADGRRLALGADGDLVRPRCRACRGRDDRRHLGAARRAGGLPPVVRTPGSALPPAARGRDDGRVGDEPGGPVAAAARARDEAPARHVEPHAAAVDGDGGGGAVGRARRGISVDGAVAHRRHPADGDAAGKRPRTPNHLDRRAGRDGNTLAARYGGASAFHGGCLRPAAARDAGAGVRRRDADGGCDGRAALHRGRGLDAPAGETVARHRALPVVGRDRGRARVFGSRLYRRTAAAPVRARAPGGRRHERRLGGRLDRTGPRPRDRRAGRVEPAVDRRPRERSVGPARASLRIPRPRARHSAPRRSKSAAFDVRPAQRAPRSRSPPSRAARASPSPSCCPPG